MKHTQSYVFFKEKIQDIFNFAVLVTNSVPVLKYNIKLFKIGDIKRLPDPDFFEPSVIYTLKESAIETLSKSGIDDNKIIELKKLIDIPLNNKEFKEKLIKIIGETEYKKNRNLLKVQSLNYINNLYDCSLNYQQKLATYLYFSTFSYFESFIYDITKEISDSFLVIDSTKYIEEFQVNSTVLDDRIKLDKKHDPRKKDRYIKYSKKLKLAGYKPPEEVFFASLVDLLNSRVNDLKANEIPDFLEKTLRFKLSDDDKNMYHSHRTNRNSIGHGDNSFKPSLKDVIELNKFFKILSTSIDKHVSLYFLRLQNFRNDC